ncbi:MAG: response regulator [Opitutaceae bacterium]|nr:response regulator [Opitutaceae bacterium]
MLSIIVLEDDAASAALVTRIFAMNGHNARSATSIGEAWRMLRAESADLLVLDTDLGGEWGWEMLERVRRSVVFRELPVIVYSSMWRRDIVRRYMLLGVQGLLVKPYTPARLMEEAARAAESGWREPFFDFPALPAADGPDAARREALQALHQDEGQIVELAARLTNNCVDIALQARTSGLAERAKSAGFLLLAEVAEKMVQAAIEVKMDRLPPLHEDLEFAMTFLRRLLGVPSRDLAPASVPAITGATNESSSAVSMVPAR